ncbi:uncharacterized protein LOC111371853 [Olea europaea var. sylvestris]|uniref:uncharacterized protein LOC111371853 n=1 Tax=Olea europaea var. sylvestris TaxID=158386 RepID=UPI000C1D0FE4|nr:uncharacterized protein LOC111371853 [Olea europaea var. sylvestris]
MDYYNILMVNRNASEDDLKTAYMRLAMIWHPDKNVNKIEAEVKFKQISEAYKVLSDPQKCQMYDLYGEKSLQSGNAYDIYAEAFGESSSNGNAGNSSSSNNEGGGGEKGVGIGSKMTIIGTSSSQNGSNNMVPPMGIPLHNTTIPQGEKLKKFTGVDFKNFLCKNYILNALDNTLYGVYSSKELAKELWDSLETKYKTKDARTKKFIVRKFLDYSMVDSKTVISQVQEIQVLLHDIHAEKMELSESFQVAAITEKLPPMWRDFKNYLKHKHKEMNLEELIVSLRIEEENRKTERRPIDQDGANFV